MSAPAATSFSLRDLPLPAKLVITCFLLAVGLGYTSAMVQLHFADSKSGQPMPTVADVVLKFTGKKWLTSDPPRPKSRLEELITGPHEGELTKQNMTPAFFGKDGGEFNRLKNGRAADATANLTAEREGEIAAVVAWIQAPPEEQQRAYEEDRFALPTDLETRPITQAFVHAVKPVKTIRIKAILTERCARCHGPNEAMAKIPLNTLDGLREYMHAPPAVKVPEGGGWVQVTQPIGLSDLTRSTHAHLLSFAVLFSLTGLVFAFTSYPTTMRCVLGPWTLVAVVTDVAFWWLARMCTDMGPYFAMGVIATGAAVGMGLGAQITLSLWNMYGPRGKAVIGLMFLAGAVIAGLVFFNQIKPGLDKKREELEKTKTVVTKPPVVEAKKENGGNGNGKTNDPPTGTSRLEKLLTVPAGAKIADLKWKGDLDSGMARAFFDKDDDKTWTQTMKDGTENEKKKLASDRHGELAAAVAWVKTPDAERRKAYEADKFELPADLVGKPITEQFKADDKSLKIKTLIGTRCVYCHGPDGEKDDAPLGSYENLLKYMGGKPAEKADAGHPRPADPVVVAPIPAAKE